MANRLEFLSFRSIRRRLEKSIAVWEDDGGAVPGAEAHLVHGRLVRGWPGRIGWWAHRVWKRAGAAFAGPTPPAASRPTF